MHHGGWGDIVEDSGLCHCEPENMVWGGDIQQDAKDMSLPSAHLLPPTILKQCYHDDESIKDLPAHPNSALMN